MTVNISLDNEEWQRVLALMSYAPGRECIPLMNKIGDQLRRYGNSGMQETTAAQALSESSTHQKN